MNKSLLTVLSIVGVLFCMPFAMNAQIVTTSPRILQTESPDVVLTYHADSPAGNNGLKGLSSSDAVYAHIGVITNKSASLSDWKYACSWGVNLDKYRLSYVSTDTWNLTIGDIRTYFGITDPNEEVQKIALVFRNADCTREGKTASGGDIFVDVYPSGFQMAMVSDATSEVITSPTTINFSISSTRKGTISLKVNGSEIASATNAMELDKSYTFSTQGNYEVVASVTAEGQTLTSSANFVYPLASAQGNYPGGVPVMGTVRNADGSVTFCVAAPDKQSAVLVPSWDNYEILASNSMKYQDYQGNRYFWITVNGIDHKTCSPYYFLIDGKKVGDPYANLVLDPYSDKWLNSDIWPDMPQYPYDKFSDAVLGVYCGDVFNYNFSEFEIPEHHNLIIYELLFRDFTGTEGRSYGDGTVRAAIEKIPYLKRMGVNAVELLPIMEFNGNNSWGYNTNFYMAPDKAYGSPLDYKEFIEECHQNGIAVILDIVFNQSDGLHPWWQLYNIDSNPFYNKEAPHAYSVLNDWRQDNPLVQKQWEDAIRFWMTEYNVDGFRFDLVKGLGDNNSYAGGTDGYNQSRVANMLRLQNVIKSVKPNGIHINENLAGDAEENAMAATGQLNWSNVNNGSVCYAQGTANGAGDINGFYAPNWSRTWGSTVSYAESHDEERVACKQLESNQAPIKNNHDLRMKRLGSLAVQMLITPGPKMIWQFGELGADESTKNSDGSNNTSSKKVVWSYMDDPDRAALLHTYNEMCGLRTLNPDLFTEDATFQVSSLASLAGRTYRIANGEKEIIVFVNARVGGSTPATVSTTASKLTPVNSKLVVASKDFTGTLTAEGTTVSVSLKPNEYAVYATEIVSGIDGVIADGVEANVSVFGSIGEIVIVGEYESVNVYSMTGQSFGNNLNVPAGMYIVNVDGHAHKIMVR